MDHVYSRRRDYPIPALLRLYVRNNSDLSAVRTKRCLRYQRTEVAPSRHYIEREHFEWWFG
jgi:hypothetical protein